MAACLKALKNQYPVELLVFRWPAVKDAPFDDDVFTWIDHLHEKKDMNAAQVLKIVSGFRPDGVLIPGWIDADYLRVARVMKRRKIPVVAGCDTQWTGSLRQRLSRYLSPWFLHTAIDVLWVTGERQRVFAKALGYASDACWSGFYACDWDRFALQQDESFVNRPEQFLYVGRYSEEKGLAALVSAYQQYRSMVSEPWPLVCAGAGAESRLLKGISGIEDRGFVQPDKLPAMMRQAQAFVLPSIREPWGVVVQEAAASGLPILCATSCGASTHLVQDGYNGFLFESGDIKHIALCMASISEASPQHRAEMGQRSYELSRQFTPDRWAQTLIKGFSALKEKQQTLVLA